ncbi:MAG TPA: DUF4258 domain-containing protein [Candidatus Kapabacteria bacterium]
MDTNEPILERVYKAALKSILYVPHAVLQMSRPERLISPENIREVIAHGEIIEDYPTDTRGHSCLILGRAKDGRHIHVVCSPKEEYLTIITAYIPSPSEWDDDLKRRKER